MLYDVVDLGQLWIRQWFITCSMPSHYLNQSWLVNWTFRNEIWTMIQTFMNKKNCHRNGKHFVQASHVNSLRQSYAYMRHQPSLSLVQIMACHLFGTKPLSEPMLFCCQLNPWEQTSAQLYLKFKHFHSRKYIWTCHLQVWWPFCLSLNVRPNWVSVHVLYCWFYRHWFCKWIGTSSKAKPLSKPMLTYCPQKLNWRKILIRLFSFKNMHLKW